MAESSRWCRSCGAEYRAGVEVCVDCGAELFDSPAPPVDHDTISYEFADWTDGQRRVVELLLGGADVPFSWVGTDLVVPRSAEDRVDEFLEHLESLPNDFGSADDTPADITVELTATTLGRVGTALQYLGGAGLVIGVIQMVAAWRSIAPFNAAGAGWNQLSYILGSFSTILIAGLVIGLGGLCRLAADWTALRIGTGEVPGR